MSTLLDAKGHPFDQGFHQAQRNVMCMARHSPPFLIVLVALLLAGCASSRLIVGESATRPAAAASESDFSVLAGAWEYEEGTAVIELTLDEQGRGSYSYKGGRFETTDLDGHEWRGRWVQAENDREGEFVVHLTADLTEGDGHWWYTRIGEVSNPTDKGGLFHLTRVVEEPAPTASASAILH